MGIELSESAILQLFDDLDLRNNVSVTYDKDSALKHFHFTFLNKLTLDIYQGDFFALNADLLGSINAIYDRGALVALPQDMRKSYSAHLLQLTQSTQQLLICYHYEKGLIQGPPHSVNAVEVNAHYLHKMNVKELYCERVKDGFRDQTEVFESVFLLQAHIN